MPYLWKNKPQLQSCHLKWYRFGLLTFAETYRLQRLVPKPVVKYWPGKYFGSRRKEQTKNLLVCVEALNCI